MKYNQFYIKKIKEKILLHKAKEKNCTAFLDVLSEIKFVCDSNSKKYVINRYKMAKCHKLEV